MLNFINDNDNLILLRDFILSINKHCDYNSKRIYYSCPYQNKFKKIHNKIIFNYIDNSYSYIYGIYVDNNKIEPQKNYKIEIKNNLKKQIEKLGKKKTMKLLYKQFKGFKIDNYILWKIKSI